MFDEDRVDQAYVGGLGIIFLIVIVVVGSLTLYSCLKTKEVDMGSEKKKSAMDKAVSKAQPTLEEIALKVAQEYELTPELTAFLLAIPDVEGRPEGIEFGVKAAKGKGIEEQAQWAAGSVKKNWDRYQAYVAGFADDKGVGVGPTEEMVDFPEFFAYQGGPYGGGWAPVEGVPEKEAALNVNWAPNMRLLWEKQLTKVEKNEKTNE